MHAQGAGKSKMVAFESSHTSLPREQVLIAVLVPAKSVPIAGTAATLPLATRGILSSSHARPDLISKCRTIPGRTLIIGWKDKRGMRTRGLAPRVGGKQRVAVEDQSPWNPSRHLRSPIEAPSKLLRNIRRTTPLPQARSTLAAGCALAGRAGIARRGQ